MNINYYKLFITNNLMEIKLDSREDTYKILDYSEEYPLPKGTYKLTIRYDSLGSPLNATGIYDDGKNINRFEERDQNKLEKIVIFIKNYKNLK